MRIVSAAGEDEVVAAFLRAEVESDRFGPPIAEILDRRRLDRSLLARPDLGDAAANAARRDVLGEHRGWGLGEGMFGGFPEQVHWWRAALTPEEVLSIRYALFPERLPAELDVYLGESPAFADWWAYR
jgi:hypothetical protein